MWHDLPILRSRFGTVVVRRRLRTDELRVGAKGRTETTGIMIYDVKSELFPPMEGGMGPEGVKALRNFLGPRDGNLAQTIAKIGLGVARYTARAIIAAHRVRRG